MSSESSRLCVLHSESSPSLGGQELRILLEMEELSVRGIESVLVARPNTPILVEAKRRGLNAHGIPMRNSFDIRAARIEPLGMVYLWAGGEG